MARMPRVLAFMTMPAHPYAVEATKNIKAAAEKAGVEYLRLLRPASPLPENCLVFESAKQAAAALDGYCRSGVEPSGTQGLR